MLFCPGITEMIKSYKNCNETTYRQFAKIKEFNITTQNIDVYVRQMILNHMDENSQG